jgi:hypothetical protein
MAAAKVKLQQQKLNGCCKKQKSAAKMKQLLQKANG